ncbi:MAG: hypothetical protein ABIE43_04615 [Patescibacteria group bacterium]
MYKNRVKFIYCLSISIILTLGLSVSFQSLIAAWAPPSDTPPSGNVGEPVNESPLLNTKSGPLWLNTLGSVATGLYVNGNVGIGTASPKYPLDIQTDSSAQSIKIRGRDNGAVDEVTIQLVNYEDNARHGYIAGASGKLSLYGGDTQTMTLDGGNVGIGTTNPNVNMKVEIKGTRGLPQSSGTTQNGILRISGSPANILDIGISNASPWGSWIQSTNSGALETVYPLLLNPNGGKVGIGTTGPYGKLVVQGGAGVPVLTAGNSTGVLFSVDSGAGGAELIMGEYNTDPYANFIQARTKTSIANPLVINPLGGNVGIGTTNPLFKLDVNGGIGIGTGTQNADLVSIGDGTTQAKLALSSGFYVGTRSNHNLYFQTNNVTQVTINNNGNVGIGIVPEYTLDVNGDLRVSGDLILPSTDLAEGFKVKDEVEPGDVLIIDSKNNNLLKKSNKPYEKLVAGVVSTKPGIKLGDNELPQVAMAGTVPVKVCNENGEIIPGDMLTTSSISGYAMKCTDFEKCFGATIGKALEIFSGEKGVVNMLVGLQ